MVFGEPYTIESPQETLSFLHGSLGHLFPEGEKTPHQDDDNPHNCSVAQGRERRGGIGLGNSLLCTPSPNGLPESFTGWPKSNLSGLYQAPHPVQALFPRHPHWPPPPMRPVQVMSPRRLAEMAAAGARHCCTWCPTNRGPSKQSRGLLPGCQRATSS